MATRKIVVAGGSGFLGSRICKSAVARGWDVVSLSRHGEPDWKATTSSSDRPRWAKDVEWAKADIRHPRTFTDHFKGASAVVHSMGILLEANYKGVVSGQESLFGAAQRALLGRGAGPAPSAQQHNEHMNATLHRTPGEEVKPDSGKLMTYDFMNRDTAIALAQEALAADVPTFVYVSAASGAPVIPGGYIRSKKEAESLLAAHYPALRSIFMRPTFLWDSSRAFTLPVALGGYLGAEANELLGGKLSFLGTMVAKPMKVDVVGEATVEAIDTDGLQGPVEPKKIDELGFKGWRKTMP